MNVYIFSSSALSRAHREIQHATTGDGSLRAASPSTWARLKADQSQGWSRAEIRHDSNSNLLRTNIRREVSQPPLCLKIRRKESDRAQHGFDHVQVPYGPKLRVLNYVKAPQSVQEHSHWAQRVDLGV